MRREQLDDVLVAVAAVVLPSVLTVILLQTHSPQREYVFIYMAVVAVIAVARGLWPALLAAAVSFLLVDYYFVPPARTLTIADEQDLVNLAIFFGTAGVVGFTLLFGPSITPARGVPGADCRGPLRSPGE